SGAFAQEFDASGLVGVTAARRFVAGGGAVDFDAALAHLVAHRLDPILGFLAHDHFLAGDDALTDHRFLARLGDLDFALLERLAACRRARRRPALDDDALVMQRDARLGRPLHHVAADAVVPRVGNVALADGKLLARGWKHPFLARRAARPGRCRGRPDDRLAARRGRRHDRLSHLIAALDTDEVGALEHAGDALVIALVGANRKRGAALLIDMRAIALDVALRRLGAEQPIEETTAVSGLGRAGLRHGGRRLLRAKGDIARRYADCFELPAGVLRLRQRAIKRDDRMLC